MDNEEIMNAPAPEAPKRRGRPPGQNKVRVAEETPEPSANAVRAPQKEPTRRKGGGDADQLYVDLSRKPEHMAYEWKRLTYGGKEDTRHQIAMAQHGAWTAVPRSRHPEIVGYNPKDPAGAIIVDGLILMERPKKLSDEAAAEDKAKARDQVQGQLQSLRLTPDGTLPRAQPKVNRRYDIAVPEDAGD